MALELRLEAPISETTVPLTLSLSGIPYEPAEVDYIDLWWAYEDDVSTEGYQRQFLGVFPIGETLSVPFPQTNRSVRFWQRPHSSSGVEAQLNFDQMEQTVFTPTPTPEAAYDTAVASEALTRGMLVDLYDDSGTLKARKADATDNTRFADAFVDADADVDENVRVYFAGSTIGGLSGLTQGETLFLSETAGGVTHTSPSGTSKISQIVGTALSPTSAVFDPQEPIELA